MECVIKKEQDKKFKKKILKPLSEFEHYIEEQHASFPKNNKKYRKGLVLCHGHKHSNEIISKIKFIEHWYMVDIDKNTHPDYIADAANSEDMSYFPDNFFDSILTEYCTVIDHEDNLIYDHFSSIDIHLDSINIIPFVYLKLVHHEYFVLYLFHLNYQYYLYCLYYLCYRCHLCYLYYLN